MPKMKTHRAGAKRYKLTASGKLLRNQANRSHINTKKSSARKRRLDAIVAVSAGDCKKLKMQLPYAKAVRR
jgi:large subunit ribosomal protein L35